jgi:hypothetical protein
MCSLVALAEHSGPARGVEARCRVHEKTAGRRLGRQGPPHLAPLLGGSGSQAPLAPRGRGSTFLVDLDVRCPTLFGRPVIRPARPGQAFEGSTDSELETPQPVDMGWRGVIRPNDLGLAFEGIGWGGGPKVVRAGGLGESRWAGTPRVRRCCATQGDFIGANAIAIRSAVLFCHRHNADH